MFVVSAHRGLGSRLSAELPLSEVAGRPKAGPSLHPLPPTLVERATNNWIKGSHAPSVYLGTELSTSVTHQIFPSVYTLHPLRCGKDGIRSTYIFCLASCTHSSPYGTFNNGLREEWGWGLLIYSVLPDDALASSLPFKVGVRVSSRPLPLGWGVVLSFHLGSNIS